MGGGDIYLFVIFSDLYHRILFWPTQFINFLNFTRDYKKVHKYIIDGWYSVTVLKWLRNILEIRILSEVNKVFKDNPNFVSSLLYFVPTV